MSSLTLPAPTAGRPPAVRTVSVQLGPTYYLHGVPCVVCGQPVHALAFTPQLRVIHHVNVRYPCYTHYDTPKVPDVQNVQDGPVLGA